MKKFLLSMVTTFVVAMATLVNVNAELSSDFINACSRKDWRSVNEMIIEGSNVKTNFSGNYEDFSPLAIAGFCKNKEALLYLMKNCDEVDVNENIVGFCKSSILPRYVKLPLFFGLLYENDNECLSVLLNNKKFDIESLEIGFSELSNYWIKNVWKIGDDTKKVLLDSEYKLIFEWNLMRTDSGIDFVYKPRFMGYIFF